MRVQTYSRFIKIEHTLFSIPLLFAGAWIAQGGIPPLRNMVLILIAGASARIVAMSLNRIIDRDVDRLNPRTEKRELASGEMNLFEAWTVTGITLGIYLFSAWLLSDFCLKLSWIPILAFGAYPYFKRFTKWAHVGLGLVWSLVPLGGFFAITPGFNGIAPAAVLGVFCIFWLAGFDIIYATADEEYDRKAGLHSLPAKLGSAKALKFAAFFHLLAFLSLIVLYSVWLSGPITVMLLVVTGILLFLEQKFSEYVDMAFFQMNVVIGFVVFFFVISGLKGY